MTAPQNARPEILSPVLGNIPAELRTRPQWVAWRLVWRPGRAEEPGKWTKVPHSTNGKPASSTDPATWSSFDAAVAAWRNASNRFDGIGFVFAADDPYFGVDLDHCRDPETGELTPAAAGWIKRFGTYAEVSPSGSGVKLIGVGALPEGMSGRRLASVGVECYERARFFTITGHSLDEGAATVEPSQEALTAFLAEFFPPSKPRATPAPRPAEPTADLADDHALIARALAADNGAKFGALWNGNTAGCPGPSEADAALVSMLAFWTGPDPARIERLMRRSGLERDKWDSARGTETYLSYTVRNVLEKVTEFYTPGVVNPNLGRHSESEDFGKLLLKGGKRERPESVGGEREKEGSQNTPYKQQFNNYTNSAESDPWDGEPLPFGDEMLPELPVGVLPEPLRGLAEGLAVEVGTAPALPAVQALAAVAAAVQKRVVVEGKPGHTEPLSLWGISIAPPGSRKSAIVARVSRPMREWEAQQNIARGTNTDDYESARRVAQKRLDKAENAAAAKPTDTDALAELDDARGALHDIRLPLRLLVQDATPEELARIMSENGGRMAVIDAEGATFGHMTGRYTNQPALEVYLKAHAGETHSLDRSGGGDKPRRSVVVKNAALTLGLAVQPEVLRSLRQKREVGGLGVLARCLFSFADDPDAGEEYLTPQMDPDAEEAFRQRIEELLRLAPTPAVDREGEPVPHTLRLDPGALAVFVAFYGETRAALRSEGSGRFAEWLSKLHGTCLRLAGVLHMASHGEGGIGQKIGAATMTSAVELARYFSTHARAALAKVSEDDATEGALRVLAWVKRNRQKASGAVSLRTMRQDLRTFASAEELLAALYLLASRGYARELAPPEHPENKPGPKPPAPWQFHPSLTWEVEA